MGLPPLLLTFFAGMMGLCLGSFLNVVITRLPVMLMRQWRNEALASLEQPTESTPAFQSRLPTLDVSSLRARDCMARQSATDRLAKKRRGRCAHCQNAY
ncbi:hypothetical protein DK37_12945 [Halomonas sp. SUBG004]|nr:hypothetical protein DK37_12945 [Halomonas sp. SUBG004]